MKIGIKISIGFIIVNLLLAIIVFLSLYSLNNIKSDLDRVAYQNFPKTVWANNVIDAINDGARALRNLMLTDDPDETKNNYDRLDLARDAVIEATDSLRANAVSQEEIDIVDNIIAKRNLYVDAREEVLIAILSGEMEYASELLLGDLRGPQRDYLNATNEAIAYQNSAVNKAAEEANEAYSQMFMILLIVAIIAIVFAIIITVFLVRAITKPLNQAVEAAENISKGNVDVNLETTNKDETAVLLGAMKTMANNIKKLVAELKLTSEAAVEGKLDKRADESAFQGEFKNIMKGVNGTLDAVIGPLNVTAEYVDRISKGDIPPRITDKRSR